MEKLDNALCQWIVLYIHYFYFLIFMHLTNQVSQTKRQINIPLWTHMGHKGWREDEKTFTRCCTISLKFWHELYVNFVLLYFSSYSSIKIWHLYFKNMKKKTVLRYQNIFNIKKHLALVLKKIGTCTFLCILN